MLVNALWDKDTVKSNITWFGYTIKAVNLGCECEVPAAATAAAAVEMLSLDSLG